MSIGPSPTGPDKRKGRPRRSAQPDATPHDQPEVHSEMASANGPAGYTLAQASAQALCRTCSLPLPVPFEESARHSRGATQCPGCARPFPIDWIKGFSAPVLWNDTWTTSHGLRVRGIVVGEANGGARRRWIQSILFGREPVSSYSHDPAGDPGALSHHTEDSSIPMTEVDIMSTGEENDGC